MRVKPSTICREYSDIAHVRRRFTVERTGVHVGSVIGSSTADLDLDLNRHRHRSRHSDVAAASVSIATRRSPFSCSPETSGCDIDASPTERPPDADKCVFTQHRCQHAFQPTVANWFSGCCGRACDNNDAGSNGDWPPRTGVSERSAPQRDVCSTRLWSGRGCTGVFVSPSAIFTTCVWTV